MEQVSLRARTGRTPGSRASRRLRREGQVPAVVYGREIEPLHIAVDARELYGVLHTDAGLNALITLEVDDGKDEILTMARIVERHPFRAEYRHVELDINDLDVGDALRIADLPEIEGVTYLEDPEYVVVSVTYPAAEIEEPEPELAEGEEEGVVPEGEEAAEGEEEAAEGEEEPAEE